MIRRIRSIAFSAVVLTLASCADVPTVAPAAEATAPLLSTSLLGEIDVHDVQVQGSAWEIYHATTHHSSITSRQWVILQGASDHSPWGTGAYKYTAIRPLSEGPGCVEVGLSTGFSDGSWKWRTAAVYVGGTGECSGVSIE